MRYRLSGLPGLILLAVLLLAAALPAAAQTTRKQGRQLEQIQYAYSNAIRWGEFEEAWQMVDPTYRQANPMSALALERYGQVQVSGYAERTAERAADGSITRNVDMRVINRHTMAERGLRYQEQWRWDPEARRWWLAVGLPDFWNGE